MIKEIEKEITVEEKQKLLKKSRSGAEKARRAFIRTGMKSEPGLGKGKEPDPWCECHNRNPCPIDIELRKVI